MKKFIFFAAMAAMAMTSCSKSETVGIANNEMNFNAYTYAPSKAVEADIEALKAGYLLKAYQTEGNFGAGNSTVFFDDKLTFSNSAWSPAKGPYYWPVNKTVSFFGVYPTTGITISAAGTDYPSFTYTAATEANNQVDVMVASTMDKTSDQVVSNFKHALTQVNIKLQGAKSGFTYTVTKVEVKGLQPSGTFTYNSATDAVPGSWGSLTGIAVDYAYGSGTTTVNDTDLTDINGATALMIIPQTGVVGTTISVTYSVTDDANATKVFDGTKTVSLDKKVLAAGTKILYSLTLPTDAKEMSFSAEVSPWAEIPETHTLQ